MTLAMTRPWKHPKTGIFWLRKRVPKDLLLTLGKNEEKRSLATRDPIEAKRRLAQLLVELDTHWHALRASATANLVSHPPRAATLSESEAHQRAEWMYTYWLDKHRENPSDQTFWPIDAHERLWTKDLMCKSDGWSLDGSPIVGGPSLPPMDLEIMRLERWCFEQADLLLIAHDVEVDPNSRAKLAKALSASVQRASLKLACWARGEFAPEERPAHWAAMPPAAGSRTAKTPVLRLGELVEGWAAEKRPVERTLYEWKRVVCELAAFLGHDDAHRLATIDLLAWKARLIELGRKPKTIRDGRLAPIRAILQWAVDNGRIASNVAERISIDIRIKPGEKKRGFTDDEAAVILRAANKETDAVRSWVPWLSAFTGARISEICQLRATDICQVEGVWAISFSPEAGNLKNLSSERVIPIHPALLERGLIAFARSVKTGPLFANLAPDRFGKRGGNGTKVLGRWVRSLGLTDNRLSPLHSWRHRFKTSGRRHGLAPDVLDALAGHAPRTVADRYGEYPMEALLRELVKIPSIKL